MVIPAAQKYDRRPFPSGKPGLDRLDGKRVGDHVRRADIRHVDPPVGKCQQPFLGRIGIIQIQDRYRSKIHAFHPNMDNVFPFSKASFLKSCHPRFGIAPSLPLFTLPKFLPLSSFPQSERMQETGTFIIHQNPFKFGGAVQDPGRPLDNLHPACGAGPCPGIPPRPFAGNDFSAPRRKAASDQSPAPF